MANVLYPTDLKTACQGIADQLNAVAKGQYKVVESQRFTPSSPAEYHVQHTPSGTDIKPDYHPDQRRFYRSAKVADPFVRVLVKLKDKDTWNNVRERQYGIKGAASGWTINAAAIHKAVTEAAERYAAHNNAQEVKATKTEMAKCDVQAILKERGGASGPYPGADYLDRVKLANGITVEVQVREGGYISTKVVLPIQAPGEPSGLAAYLDVLASVAIPHKR